MQIDMEEKVSGCQLFHQTHRCTLRTHAPLLLPRLKLTVVVLIENDISAKAHSLLQRIVQAVPKGSGSISQENTPLGIRV